MVVFDMTPGQLRHTQTRLCSLWAILEDVEASTRNALYELDMVTNDDLPSLKSDKAMSQEILDQISILVRAFSEITDALSQTEEISNNISDDLAVWES